MLHPRRGEARRSVDVTVMSVCSTLHVKQAYGCKRLKDALHVQLQASESFRT